MKKSTIIMMIIIVILLIYINVDKSSQIIEEEQPPTATELVIPQATEEIITADVHNTEESNTEYDLNEADMYEPCSINETDMYELRKIAMAEAEGEGVEGKAYVMMVILNRVNDNRFPNTVHDVIFQKNQFTPVRNGRYNRVVPDAECEEALNMIILNGWDKSQGALYFESCKNANNWHSRNLTYLFTHDGHRFYR